MVQVGECLDKRQSDASAVDATLHLVEAVENVFELFLGHAYPRVLDRKSEVLVVGRGREGDVSSLFRVFDGIA